MNAHGTDFQAGSGQIKIGNPVLAGRTIPEGSTQAILDTGNYAQLKQNINASPAR